MIGDKLIITTTVCNQGSHCAVVAMQSAVVPNVHAYVWHVPYNKGANWVSHGIIVIAHTV